MYGRFIRFIEEKQLFVPGQKILLALSGGIDSMVLLHLFEKAGIPYGVVHCNFKLRGLESDGDEKFVWEQASARGIPVYFQQFDTVEYAAINGISIEMAARELRYTFFEKVRIENGYDFIATAHHRDDLIETFFLNLSRKTGIHGLTGIKEKAGNIIRPLLFTGRAEIEAFCSQYDVPYREDSSNSEVFFQRNFIRHKIVPQFSALNPSFHKNMVSSIENLKAAESVYDYFTEKEAGRVVDNNEEGIAIDVQKLNDSPFPFLVLLEILKPYGFNSTVISEIFGSLDSESGKQFFSRTHRLIKDREKLYVVKVKSEEDHLFYIEERDLELFEPFEMNIETIQRDKFRLVRDPHLAFLDRNRLEFPLLIRKWKQGDYFQPFGMQGFKKVSDFFIDQKIPVHEKENTWILCSGKDIVWIIGYRIDNRFRIRDDTQTILKLEIRKNIP